MSQSAVLQQREPLLSESVPPKGRRSLGNSIDIARKTKAFQIFQKSLIEQLFPAQKSDIFFGEAEVFDIVNNLFKTCSNRKSAVIRHAAEEYVKISFFS